MIQDIWASYRRLPLWVQIWVAVILVPVNLIPLAFPGAPNANLIATLAVAGMALNLPIMIVMRGMSRAMSLPHILCWGPMVIIVALTLRDGAALSSGYVLALSVLLIVDLISLGFDLRDAVMWFRGDRSAT